MTVPVVLLGLLEDTSLLGRSEPTQPLAAYLSFSLSPLGGLLGPLLVPDVRLAEVGRAVGAQPQVPVCVANSTGAGGLLSLAGRSTVGVQVVAVESALRDLDDLVGNAARIVAAASQLDGVEVYVEIPYAPRWENAVEVVEAAGLQCALRTSDAGNYPQLVQQLRGLIEADVPFKTTGPVSVLGLLAAVEALVEDANLTDSAALLTTSERSAGAVASWDDTTAARVRRRLRLVGCPSVPEAAAELVEAGLVSRA